MSYRYESTNAFMKSIEEVETLLKLAKDDEDNRILFLKLAVVSLVTKLQVYVEGVLDEFRFELNGKPSKALSTYMVLNSLSLSIGDNNALLGLTKHSNYTQEKKESIIRYINSIGYCYDPNAKIDESFRFNTKYPLGRTGTKELISLFKQIKGTDNPFEDFGDDNMARLDSLLQIRHLIIHQDRFLGTDETLCENLSFLKKLVTYIDNYLTQCIEEIETKSA